MTSKTSTTSPTAEVFLTAIKSLPKKDKDSFFIALAKDKKLYEELRDIALIEKRRGETSRSFREFLNENP